MTNYPHSIEELLNPERNARLDKVLDARSRSLILVLDQVMNPHNISAVLRSADAFGLQEIHLIGEEFEYSTGVSLRSERWLDLHRHRSAAEAIGALKTRGYKIVIAESPLTNPLESSPQRSVPVYDLPFEENLAMVFGNEHRGISAEFSVAADLRMYIPMLGFAESFNISVAAAITMYSSLLGKVEGQRKLRPLNEADRIATKEIWAAGSLRHGDVILREIKARQASGSQS